MSSGFRLSADGLFYWNGTAWVSALSADGRHRWDGSRWVPIAASQVRPAFEPQAPPANFAQPRRTRIPTSQTRPLQYAAAGFFALSIVVPVVSIGFSIGDLHDYARQVALRQAAQSPELYPDPAGYADTMTGVVDVVLVLAVVFIIAVGAVAITGALRRWTWAYYAILAWLALSVIEIPASALRAVGAEPAPALPPALQAEQWVGLGYGLLAAALGAWMLYVLLRVGPWATRRAPAAA